ncbi:HD domain-containing protein [Aminipila butyrica]|uniref:bis(5'-nucleosyl)-tetraphosphatase (symmetrical) n=1 Tax=Aminipila butyrica TaxID=433296 RepID=A0A858BTV4_9FIRM|nr:bis(5'-nucleosyl)-tetraphosphatase (symmetrical) YqeK [Aminipila butyrica]QIB69451.1 HD domain-containing protein [Aminipila butyrica]
MKRDCIVEQIEKNISEKRKKHIFAMRDTALKLASFYGINPQKAETAALFHDLFRELPQGEMNNWVMQLGLDSKYLNNRNLAHSKIAALLMEKDYGITDPDILQAVSYHTTGRAGMSQLEKIIYLADAIEPGRNYPGVEELRKAAFTDLDQACLLSLSRTIDYVRSQQSPLDDDTVKARDYLMELKIKGDVNE